MLVTDHSRSMLATDVEPDRLTAAKRAARSFLERVPTRVRVGVVAFSNEADAVESPSRDRERGAEGDRRSGRRRRHRDRRGASGRDRHAAAGPQERRHSRRPRSSCCQTGGPRHGPRPARRRRNCEALADPDLHRQPWDQRRDGAEPRLRPTARRGTRPRDARPDRRDLRWPCLHCREFGRAVLDLQSARLAAGHEEGTARDHDRIRDRWRPAAARRGGGFCALDRPVP